MYAFLPQYAKEGVKEKPRSVVDLLKPEFEGRIINTYPHDDAVFFIFDRLMKIHGEGIIDRFAEAKPDLIHDTAGPPVLVGMNGYLGSLTGYRTHPDRPSMSYIPEGNVFISWPSVSRCSR